MQLSKQLEPVNRDKLEELTAKIYLDSGKKKNTFTRDLNALLKMELIIENEGLFGPNINLILERLPFRM